VNQISAYASVELNMDVRNTAFVAAVEQELESLIRDSCVEVDPDNFIHTNGILRQLMQRLSYEIIRMIFFLFTFYFKQEKEARRP
jgi:cardiolipin synthase